jgi:hypothetical protein
MQMLETFLADKREVTIHTLASYLREAVQERWETVIQENLPELLQLFEKAGEPTYGVYGQKLLGPLFEQIERAGFRLEGGSGTPPTNSVEYWGPPEERERCIWYLVKRADGSALGTLVQRFFHDHTRFRIPHAPSFLALEETEKSAILTRLSRASARLGPKEFGGTFSQDDHARSGWEYSVETGLGDCFDAAHPELTEGLLDHSLALWGRYGWELITVVSHEGHLLAYFKRQRLRQVGGSV